MGNESCASALATILNDESVEHVMNAYSELYLVNQEVMAKLLFLDAKVESGEDSKDKFSRYVKLINPQEVAYRYEVLQYRKYKQIHDRDKVREQLGLHLGIFENKEKKRIQALRDKGTMTKEEMDEIEHDFEINFALAQEQYALLKENFDAYDVVITNFEEMLMYDALACTLLSGKTLQSHLRLKVPNVLWLEVDEFRAKHREHYKIEKIVREYKQLGGAGGLIYFKKRDL